MTTKAMALLNLKGKKSQCFKSDHLIWKESSNETFTLSSSCNYTFGKLSVAL